MVSHAPEGNEYSLSEIFSVDREQKRYLFQVIMQGPNTYTRK
jgi:hypothetical protein